jgi:hypothetical protein
MSDTLGSLVDKLVTVDMKMWHNQEFLYEARRMNFEEFQAKFCSTEEAQLSLYESIKKCCDLNYQRNVLIDEIDKYAAKIRTGNVDPDDMVQLKHKTY